MKDLIIKNIADIEGHVMGPAGSGPINKPVVAGDDVDTCAAAFVEIPVGTAAVGYHYHDQCEEIFYIVSGSGKMRCIDGEKDIRAGDMLCFPTGEKGGHVLINTSESEPLVYIDFGVKAAKLDIVVFPETNSMMIMGTHVKGMFDMTAKVGW